MKFSAVAAVAALSAVANADVSPQQVTALEALFQDIITNRDQYVSFIAEATSFDFPTGLIGIYTAVTTYTDNGYTSLFSTIDASELNQIHTLATILPWYSSRLAGSMNQITVSATSSGAASSATAAASSASNSTITSAASNATVASASGSASITASSAASSAASVAPASSAGAAANSTNSSSSTSSAAAAINSPSLYGGLALGASVFAYMLL